MSINRPSKVVFWISLIIGAFAILNQFVLNIKIPIVSEVSNMVLLTIAFILLVIGVVFKSR